MAKTTKKTTTKSAAPTTVKEAITPRKAVSKKASTKKQPVKQPAAKKIANKKAVAKPATVKAAPAKKPAKKKVASAAAAPAKSGMRRISAADRLQMVAEAAYLRGESQGFLSDEREDWLVAETEVDAMLAKANIQVVR